MSTKQRTDAMYAERIKNDASVNREVITMLVELGFTQAADAHEGSK